MKIIKHETIEEFLLHNEELLLKNESFYNLILGLAYGIQKKTVTVTSPLYYSIEDNKTIIACALRSNLDKPLAITEMPQEAIAILIQNLLKYNVDLAGVVGEEKAATYFRDQWIENKALTSKVRIHLGVYECKKVISKEINESLVLASNEHKDIAKDYIANFCKECFPNEVISNEEIERMVNRNIENKSLYLLQNNSNQLVSMAGNVRSSINSGTISLVYTPTELRGKGHGSAVVSLLSEKLIREGKKFTNLFTDLTNPTSNSIYQKIGYVKIGQNIHFDFQQPTP